MNILITGGAGFIGSFLVDEFLEKNHKVVCIDNLFRGSLDNLKSALDSEYFEYYNLDISTDEAPSMMKSIIFKHEIDAVFHLAAINGTEYFYDSPYMVLDKNIVLTQNLLKAVKGTNVSYLMYASSSEVYGDPLQIPTEECHKVTLNLEADRDSYASSKAIGDFYFRLFGKQNNIPTLVVRFFNQYGPRMVNTKYGQVVAEFITRCSSGEKFTIIGDGSQTRSFCYIKDATKILEKLYNMRYSGTLNIGNTDEVTINQLASLVHTTLESFDPSYLPARPNDHMRRCPDISKLLSVIGPYSFINLKDGLRLTSIYYVNKK